jgi:predicted component of type VI protein secretion system
MQLTLSILNGPDGPATVTRQFGTGTVTIGRAPDNDWVLPDPQRHLSKRHCSLAFRDGFWALTDLSTNGTYLNDARDPIGQAGVHDVCHGDRIRIGSYELAVTIATDEAERASDDAADGSGWLEADAPLGEGFVGPAQADHTPEFADAFRPPQPVVLLDEDWDLSPGGSAAPQAMASPVSAVPAERPDFAAPTDTLLSAFLHGAGMPGAKPVDPAAAMENLGAAFRALASGLRETLMARAAIKSEFRIEQTMIRAHGNNPLKFSASDDDALLALLGERSGREMAPAQAVAEAFHDLRLHELATMAAMQTAVRGVLRELDPARFRDSAGSALLGAQRKARAFEAYEVAHARLTQAMADNFDSVFGKAFAKAYEQALRSAGDN